MDLDTYLRKTDDDDSEWEVWHRSLSGAQQYHLFADLRHRFDAVDSLLFNAQQDGRPTIEVSDLVHRLWPNGQDYRESAEKAPSECADDPD